MAGVHQMLMAGAVAPLVADAVPDNADGVASTSTVTSNSVTVNVTGGTPSYSYSWAMVSGDTDIVVINPTSATTAFRKVMSTGTNTFGTARCTVTDAGSREATVDVVVTLERT